MINLLRKKNVGGTKYKGLIKSFNVEQYVIVITDARCTPSMRVGAWLIATPPLLLLQEVVMRFDFECIMTRIITYFTSIIYKNISTLDQSVEIEK